MIITLTSTIVSALILGVLYLNKAKELRRGKGMFSLGNDRTDRMVSDMHEVAASYASVLHPKSLKRTLTKAVIKAERFLIQMFARLSSRFNVVGEIVTGRDIPKNRGSVSFFLKNIEDSKKIGKKHHK